MSAPVVMPQARFGGEAGGARPGAGARGFTLVEVLVASLILALALIALSSLFALGIKNNAVAKEDTVMAAFAQEKLEELKKLPRLDLDGLFTASCQGTCLSSCPCSDPGCDPGTCCAHICFPTGCAAADRVVQKFENPLPDPNPSDEVRERLYVRAWEVTRVNLGQPVGCVYKITVTVGSRNALLAPKPESPEPQSWLLVSKEYVVGAKNPRRIIVSTYRSK